MSVTTTANLPSLLTEIACEYWGDFDSHLLVMIEDIRSDDEDEDEPAQKKQS